MAPKEVHLALIFHCNQGISNFAQLAAENCYRGLVRVLDRHPKACFNFHWSGSLLTSLRWWYPELIAQIREHLDEGRWETLASTYAQSVPHTGPDSLNDLALGVHRAVLRGAFRDWTPRGYWISERSWRPEMADEIAAAGLEYAMIEDHMLRAAGWTDLHRPKQMTTPAGRGLSIFTDNEEFKHPINCAIWTGNLEPALEHIRRVRDEQTGDVPPILTYGEDGEVCGLWPAERGCPPQIAWEHLDRLLTALEREPGVRLTRLCDYVDQFGDRFEPAPCIPPEGQAEWMCASLSDHHLPYHEPGYHDWFDFNRRAPKIKRFRPLFDTAASEINALKPRGAARGRLHLHAAMALAAHTFEFGCIGIGSPRASMWDRHRVAQLPLALARGEAPTENGPVNLNGDRRREHALVSKSLLSLWSHRTGILLHLFDLPTGDEMIGNEIAAARMWGAGHDEEVIAETPESEIAWSGFRSSKQRLTDFNGNWREVRGSQAWMRWLLNWDDIGGLPKRIRQVKIPRKQYWSLEEGSQEETGIHWPSPTRQRALVERLLVDGEEILDVAAMTRDSETKRKFTETESGFEITLTRRPVELTKRVSLKGREVRVDYDLTNHTPNHLSTELQITSEWVPSYLTLLLMGRESVVITDHGARNVLTGAGVEFTLDSEMTAERTVRESQFGLLDTRCLQFNLSAGTTQRISTRLRIERGQHFDHIDHIAKDEKSWPGSLSH